MPRNILFVIAEMAPLVKVGGLGDVGGALPKALRRLGLDVRVALPYFAAIEASPARIAALPDGAALWETEVGGVPAYLVEHKPSFGREDVYGYDDDGERFLAFCDALLASADALEWRPDLLHLNDWHPGLLAARLAAAPEHSWAGLPRVCTIHNLGFAGPFDEAFAREHGIATADGPASHSALGQSILHADVVSTVSPTYAREIVTPEFGGELAPVLQSASGGGDRLCGILNGIDTEAFDPATDRHLAARFDGGRLERRIVNKLALQRRLSLPADEAIPLVGMVARLFWQKGPDLAAAAVEALLARHRLQFAVLGQGDEEHERPLRELAARHPGRVAVRIAFDLPLGQLIYGGCDLFLMPSRYEPCGLGQFIAMRYGAVPVVRRTGGLADSVPPYDAAGESGLGFVFDEATLEATAAALEEALAVFQDRASWRRLQQRGMGRDFSWGPAAQQYRELYERAAGFRAERAAQ